MSITSSSSFLNPIMQQSNKQTTYDNYYTKIAILILQVNNQMGTLSADPVAKIYSLNGLNDKQLTC